MLNQLKMLGVIVFIASFLFLFILTLIFPSVPPGQILIEVLGNMETTYSVAGVSEKIIMISIINGLVWGSIIVIAFFYWRGPSKNKIDLPVWVPGYATSGSSKIEHKKSRIHDKFSFDITRRSNSVKITEIVGAGYASKLGKIGIRTLDDLIDVGATRTGRNYLAKKIGVTHSMVLYWVQQAEIRR